MEKITYQPLVAHLRDQYQIYNQLYLEAELRYGSINQHELQHWLVTTVEPIIIATNKIKPESLNLVFKAFYSSLLTLSGNGLLITYEQEYRSLWNIFQSYPQLLVTYPNKIISAMHQALAAVHLYQPSRTMDWIRLMIQTIPFCKSPEDLLNCGRMNAWFCGLAQLRENCAKIQLPEYLRSELQKNCPLPYNLETVLQHSWTGKSVPQFINTSDGFAGFNGSFMQPPSLSITGEQVLASDGESTFIVFADDFGQLVLPYQYQYFKTKNDSSSLSALKNQYHIDLAGYSDISACVISRNTLFLTRYSSHHIFIYGWQQAS